MSTVAPPESVGQRRRNRSLIFWVILGLSMALGVLGSVPGAAQQTASLSIEKTAPAEIFVNNAFDYTLTVTNHGPNAASDVTVTDRLPSAVSFMSSTAEGGCADTGASTYECALGTIGAGETVSVALTVTADALGDAVVNEATVASDGHDVDSTDNTSTVTIAINLRPTSTAITGCDGPLSVNATSTCTVEITDTAPGNRAAPAGDVTFTDSTGDATFENQSCSGNGSDTLTCTVDVTPTSAGHHAITATYAPGGASANIHASSEGTVEISVNKRSTEASVNCDFDGKAAFIDQSVKCRVTVTDTEGGTATAPTGTVSFGSSATGGTAAFSPSSCNLTAQSSDASACSVSYMRTRIAEPDKDGVADEIIATYAASDAHGVSEGRGALPVVKRPASVEVECTDAPSTSTCTITVTDAGVAGTPSTPRGTVAEPETAKACTLSGGGCTLTVDVSRTLVSYLVVKYQGSDKHLFAPGWGRAAHSVSGVSTSILAQGPERSSSTMREAVYTLNEAVQRDLAQVQRYQREALKRLNREGGTPFESPDVPEGVRAAFSLVRSICSDVLRQVLDGNENPSTIDFSTDITDPFGSIISAGEMALPELLALLEETIRVLETIIPKVLKLTGTVNEFLNQCIVCVDLGIAEINVTVGDIPPIGTLLSNIVEPLDNQFRSLQRLLDATKVVVADVKNAFKLLHDFGAVCKDEGVPELFQADAGDQVDIQDRMITIRNNCNNWDTLDRHVSELTTIIGSIPLGEVANAIAEPVSIVLGELNANICNLDFDGLPINTWLQVAVGLDPSKADTDGDHIDDWSEIVLANGKVVAWRKDIDPLSEPCPTPINSDSDGDGVTEGGELNSYGTLPCNPDGDADGVSDGVEISTRYGATSDQHGFVDLGNEYTLQDDLPIGPGPDTYFSGFDDDRMWADPGSGDSAGDGLSDRYLVGRSCDKNLANSNDDVTYGPFVGVNDSDNDGLLDGAEQVPQRDAWSEALADVQLGDSGSSGTGWSDPCNSDTDGDGLSDAEEVNLWGTSVEATTPFGTSTVPALDDDMDRDGLSDAEEQRITQTDPVHADTDGDTIVDANELIATGGTWPERTFRQTSDPLARDTDGDGIPDNVEWDPTVEWDGASITDTSLLDVGTGLGDPDGAAFRGTGGQPDDVCPHVSNPDSDGDGLLDGDEVTPTQIGMHNGVWPESTADIRAGGRDSTGKGWTDPCDPDTDGDGLSDAEEVDLWGADAVDPTSTSPASGRTVPALDTDIDQDRLSDFEEVNTVGTDALHADTDGDTITDANELITSGGAWPDRAFHQVSDPLTRDTDSDDLPDNYEWEPTVVWDSTTISEALDVGTGLGDPNRPGGFTGQADEICPRVDKPDTDGDALLDGDEVTVAQIKQNAGIWNESWPQIRIGDSTHVGKGWTDPCNPDTDGDRLSDGIEVGTWGEETEATAPDLNVDGRRTVGTVPALDDDIDQDGLSDFEESNTVGTDALHADTDGDRITDANELIATGGSFPARSFRQESNPQSQNSDDDQMLDDVEWVDAADGLRALRNTAGTGVGDLSDPAFRSVGGVEDTVCPFVDNGDSDEDGVIDGLRLTLSVSTATSQYKPAATTEVTFDEGFDPIDHGSGRLGVPADNDGHIVDLAPGADARGGPGTTENTCNPDSDGDGLNDGAESQHGSDPGDWDTDNDGLPDNEADGVFGQVPATNPLDPDSDDDGLIDGTEIVGELNPAAAPLDAFVSNPTSPDTDNDGLCDGGEPARVANTLTVLSSECTAGILDHPNDGSTPGLKLGLGEDEDGDGVVDPGETSPLKPDTDSDGVLDGVEKLGFSVDRQGQIPDADARGRDTRVSYPDPGCLDPLDPDTDRDGLIDGEEDVNGNGHLDFEPSDFDWEDLVGIEMAPAQPPETNPCDPDTDDDSHPGSLNRFGAAGGNSSDAEERERGTNPLDFDSDNDLLDDGVEVAFRCVAPSPESGFTFTTIPNLDPLDRDSDSDGIIDGLENADRDAAYDPNAGETNPCASPPIPVVDPPGGGGRGGSDAEDTDGDGFPDEAERAAGTDPNDPNDQPDAFFADLNLNDREDNLVWLEDENGDGVADSVALDMDGDREVDERIDVVTERDLDRGDFNEDGREDCRYRVAYAVGEDQRVLATIVDFGCDLSIDEVELEELE